MGDVEEEFGWLWRGKKLKMTRINILNFTPEGTRSYVMCTRVPFPISPSILKRNLNEQQASPPSLRSLKSYDQSTQRGPAFVVTNIIRVLGEYSLT